MDEFNNYEKASKNKECLGSSTGNYTVHVLVKVSINDDGILI